MQNPNKMSKNLVIVESPAKAKTIEKFLGKDYVVKSSYGHIRDLKKKNISIDFENDFSPIYEIPADKKELVAELKAEAKKADIVWLASDEDREGEAISWHLYEVLGLKPENTRRIVFHEITKDAILKAIENPREIDINLVDAQQARRVLDRIVGFELSPVLWKKVKPALSAGRVQSVAVRLIVEREKEIDNFKSEALYKVNAIFIVKSKTGKDIELKSELDTRFKTKEEAMDFVKECAKSEFKIEDIVTRPGKKSPAAPFTTSTLQQEAARKLGYGVAQTMRIAQSLYESGFITYMRTDSVNLSSLAIGTAKSEIVNNMGEEYLHTRQFSTKSKGAQEAHEAIRPTYISNHSIEGSAQERRLYELIWKRTIASQMADAQLEKTTATISVSESDNKFIATGEVIKFDGFLKVYIESSDDDDVKDDDTGKMLPPLTVGQELPMKEVLATERFSQRPARYSEASLVRKMEELGIGRPSTYAPTISTIQNREYVEKSDLEGNERKYNVITLENGEIRDEIKTEITGADKGKLIPTDIGIVVNEFLTENFPDILNYNFTAKVEQEFDNIAEGKEEWTKALDDFYKVFHPSVTEAIEAKSDKKVGERILGVHPENGRQVSVKISRFGPVVQIGKTDEEEKPVFASLLKGQSITNITLEEALKLFELPRELGEYEDKVVKVAIGRFGPYISHNSKFVSLPKEYQPMTINLEEAIALIEAKRKQEAERLIKTFEEEEGLQILNGRFGPYISYNKSNYKIPKGTDPHSLSYEDCKKLIEAAADAPKGRGKKTVAKKVEKESSPKKATVKKSEDEPVKKKPAAKKAATKDSTKKTTTKSNKTTKDK